MRRSYWHCAFGRSILQAVPPDVSRDPQGETDDGERRRSPRSPREGCAGRGRTRRNRPHARPRPRRARSRPRVPTGDGHLGRPLARHQAPNRRIALGLVEEHAPAACRRRARPAGRAPRRPRARRRGRTAAPPRSRSCAQRSRRSARRAASSLTTACALRDRDDAGDAELGGLLHHQVHLLALEEREEQRDRDGGGGRARTVPTFRRISVGQMRVTRASASRPSPSKTTTSSPTRTRRTRARWW